MLSLFCRHLLFIVCHVVLITRVAIFSNHKSDQLKLMLLLLISSEPRTLKIVQEDDQTFSDSSGAAVREFAELKMKCDDLQLRKVICAARLRTRQCQNGRNKTVLNGVCFSGCLLCYRHIACHMVVSVCVSTHPSVCQYTWLLPKLLIRSPFLLLSHLDDYKEAASLD